MDASRRSFLQTAAAGSMCAAVGSVTQAMSGEDTQPGRPPTVEPASEKLRILFLGGTMLLGPAMVQCALDRGHNVTLFNRGKTDPKIFPNVEKLVGDREKDELDALRGGDWDVVIDTFTYVPAHVRATASLVAEHARQYVVLSSVSCYADHGKPADEDSPLAECSDEFAESCKTMRESLSQYGAMKARCERAAEELMPGRVTVVRPGLIVGRRDPSDRFGYWAARVADGGEILAPGDGLDPVQYIDVRDLGEWIIRIIEKNVTGIFNGISPGGWFNMAELLYGMKAAFWTDARFNWVDENFLDENGIEAWGHMPVWMPRSMPEVSAFHLVNTDRAQAAGLKFRTLADTTQDAVKWIRANRPTDYAWGTRRAGIPREREAELLNAWKDWKGRRPEETEVKKETITIEE